MTVQRIDELLRIRIGNMSAIKRRLKLVRTEYQREIGLKELARVQAEIEDLQQQRKAAMRRAIKRALTY
jgi:hypothetical protein